MQLKKRERNLKRDQSRDYVNGKELFEAIKAWYASGEEVIPKVIVTAIMQICSRLATKNNFKNYTYIDEMKSNALISCVIAVQRKKFDPDRYDNPFAYFTRVAYNEFIRVINEEHKQVYIKHKSLEHHIVDQHLAGVDIEVEKDDSGRLDNLINKFEGPKEEK